MTTIDLDGIIGYDIDARDIRVQLPESGTLTLRINTPGGLVDEGIAITNELRAFRRNGGTVTASITGQCCSMGTYIAMFSDRLEVEDNAVFMVHNPSTIAWGDHRLMAKTARTLESVRSVLARAYQERTGRDQAAVFAEMDEETWLFGEEIVTAGYADALVPAGEGPETQDEAVALAQTSFKAMLGKLKEREADPAQLDQIAALLPQHPANSAITNQEPPMAENAKKPPVAADPNEPQTDPTTDPVSPQANPQASNPASKQADMQAAIQAAITTERSRVAAITARCTQVNMPHLAQALIDNGADLAACNAEIVDEYVAKGGAEIRQTTTQASTDTSAASWDAVVSKINKQRG